jgi:hypothetical protein
MLRKFTSLNLPRMVHESTVRFVDHFTYYEYKIALWNDLELNKMKASYKIENGYLTIRFIPPEINQDGWNDKDISIKDIE